MEQYIILLIIIVIIFTLCQNQKESFIPYRRSCRNCSYLGKRKCGTCLNCGWCINSDGKGECVPGNAYGPYFRSDCIIWRHPHRFHRFRPRFYGRVFPSYYNSVDSSVFY